VIEELSSNIWAREAFQSEYERLLHGSLVRSVHVTGATVGTLDRDSIKRLLQSASHFSASTSPVYREAAYRIATSAWTLFGGEYQNLRDIALHILGRLGNFPAANFLNGGKALNGGLPEALWLEFESRELRNSVRFGDQFDIALTDFQKRLWETLAIGESTAVTAPTSAGKSFALQRFLVNRLLSEKSWGIYIVPTRALINQVSSNLIELIRRLEVTDLSVITIPVVPSELGASAGIYVLTQERLQILLEAGEAITFRLAIIDEAQMVAEGARGVILQSVVERLRAGSPNLQFLFGSPQTRNPGAFKDIFRFAKFETVSESESPVAQNLVFVDTDPIRTDQVTVSGLINNEKRILGTVVLERALHDPEQTLAYLSWTFGANEKSLVYAGGQARCESIANKLLQLAHESSAEATKSIVDPLIRDFSEFLKTHVHPEYLLAESVLAGVAFHYGNMPAIVRKTIEEFFAEGRLAFLVCTSTLLHGVNLPAKNLFLSNPTKGRDWDTKKEIPISSLEFWNLAGRAGRLGKDFEGNVYLIDSVRWQARPFDGEKQQDVYSSLENEVVNKSDEFLSFIHNETHASGRNQPAENSFVKLHNEFRRGQLTEVLTRMRTTDDFRERVEAAIVAAAHIVDVPLEITERNINVSVYRQQEMLDHLIKRMSEDGPENFIPIHPLRPEAGSRLIAIFKRIHTHFERKMGADRSHLYFAPLAIRWMRGDPLAQLIDDALAYKRRTRKRPPKVATVIREVLASVEQDLRFRYVKFTSCYNDLLAEALRREGHQALVARIPGIPLFLELGASSKTMVNLVGMGLSRTAAGLVTEVAVNKDMSRNEVERWLPRQNWEAAGISSVVLRELQRVTK
jgi:DEAD/DEAH box helicase